MNILDALKQLRDDIKTWVAANLNALNTKIDEKTFPVDTSLNATSSNPVENRIVTAEIADINKRVGNTSVAKQISTAISKQPHFSGDYNDLENAPNIAEDDEGNLIIADELGNIIFQTDEEGIHTTRLTLNGQAAATEGYVADQITDLKNELSESITSESEEWTVADNDGNIIFTIDASGIHTTAVDVAGEQAATQEWVSSEIQSRLGSVTQNIITIDDIDEICGAQIQVIDDQSDVITF